MKLHFGFINHSNQSFTAVLFCPTCNSFCHPQVEHPTPQPPSSSLTNHRPITEKKKKTPSHPHYMYYMWEGKPCQPVMSFTEKQQMRLDTESATHSGWVEWMEFLSLMCVTILSYISVISQRILWFLMVSVSGLWISAVERKLLKNSKSRQRMQGWEGYFKKSILIQLLLARDVYFFLKIILFLSGKEANFHRNC